MFWFRGEDGISIVGVLMAAAGLGFVALATSQMVTNSAKSTKVTELRDDRVGVRQAIRSRLDCASTLTGTPCNAAPFPLKNATGGIIGTPQFGAWRLGEFHVRGTCDGTTLTIQATRLAGTGQFAVHPMTRQPETWTDLFVPGELDCANWFAGGPAGFNCGPNEFAAGITANGRPICRAFPSLTCPAGQVVAGTDSTGQPICQAVGNRMGLGTNLVGMPEVYPDCNELKKPGDPYGTTAYYAATVYCPGTYRAISGGCECHYGAIIASKPVGSNGWYCQCCACKACAGYKAATISCTP